MGQAKFGIPDDQDMTANMPSRDALRRCAQRSKAVAAGANNLPPQPTSLAEVVISPELTLTATGDLFCIYDSGSDDLNRLMIFATPAALNSMAAELDWGQDATFQCCPKLWYQLLMMHVMDKASHKAFPAVYALMARKTMAEYTRVFEVLKAVRCGTEGRQISTSTGLRQTGRSFRIILDHLDIGPGFRDSERIPPTTRPVPLLWHHLCGLQ